MDRMGITNYTNTNDWFYIVPAAILVDTIVIFLTKYAGPKPYFKVEALDEWYKRFGLAAVGADVLSLLIGIAAARYIYTALNLKPDLFLFLLVVILFQLCHDLFFYIAVIRQLPAGKNEMIDVFKAYGQENGGKILVADSLMMIGTALSANILKSIPNHITVSTLLLTLYSLCFILYTPKV